MARNRSEKVPCPHVPKRFLERLRLYTAWAYATHDAHGEMENRRVFDDYRDTFTEEEQSSYISFVDTEDYFLIKNYWMGICAT